MQGSGEGASRDTEQQVHGEGVCRLFCDRSQRSQRRLVTTSQVTAKPPEEERRLEPESLRPAGGGGAASELPQGPWL